MFAFFFFFRSVFVVVKIFSFNLALCHLYILFRTSHIFSQPWLGILSCSRHRKKIWRTLLSIHFHFILLSIPGHFHCQCFCVVLTPVSLRAYFLNLIWRTLFVMRLKTLPEKWCMLFEPTQISCNLLFTFLLCLHFISEHVRMVNCYFLALSWVFCLFFLLYVCFFLRTFFPLKSLFSPSLLQQGLFNHLRLSGLLMRRN